jgi:hypothetical protein
MKRARVRDLLLEAKQAVETEIEAARQGKSIAGPASNFQWALKGLQDMIDSIDQDQLIDPPGIAHVAGDQWDYRAKVSSAVIEAEHAYKRLL